MLKYIYIGKIVNTHALKGEVRLLSNFEFKEKVFIPGRVFYIGVNKSIEKVETYRKHKQFDMVKFVNIDNINDVLKYKGSGVYVSYDDLKLSENEVLISELVNMDIYNNNELIGKIEEYRDDNGNKMVRVNGKYIPYNKDFIEKIDKNNKKIFFHGIEVFL